MTVLGCAVTVVTAGFVDVPLHPATASSAVTAAASEAALQATSVPLPMVHSTLLTDAKATNGDRSVRFTQLDSRKATCSHPTPGQSRLRPLLLIWVCPITAAVQRLWAILLI